MLFAVTEELISCIFLTLVKTPVLNWTSFSYNRHHYVISNIFLYQSVSNYIKILTLNDLMKQSDDSDDTYFCRHTSGSFCSHFLFEHSLKIIQKFKIDISIDFLLLFLSWCYYGSSHQFRPVTNASEHFWDVVTEKC